MAVALDAPSLHGVDAALYDLGAPTPAPRSNVDSAPRPPLFTSLWKHPRSASQTVPLCAEPSRLHTAGIKTIVGADGQTHWEQPPRAELGGRSTLTTAQKQQLYRDGYVSGRDSGVGGASV